MFVVQVRYLGAAKETLEGIRGVSGNDEVDAILEVSPEVFVFLWEQMIGCTSKEEEAKLLKLWR